MEPDESSRSTHSQARAFGLCGSLFVDPIGDIAVLGPPDYQAPPDKADAYDKLVDNMGALPIGNIPQRGAVWMLNLDGRWMQAAVTLTATGLMLTDSKTAGGMSGSPIITADGAAFGILTCSRSGQQPRLVSHLPEWMLSPA
jgi:hypothetical protein